MNEENNGTAARYAGQVADRVERVADMLRNSTMDDMVGQVERFARRQPEVFVGAAFAMGFLFARFVKSSGERRFRSAGSSHLSGGYGRHDRNYRDAGMRGAERTGQDSLSGGRDLGRDLAGRSRGMAGGIAGSAAMGSATAPRPRSGISSGISSSGMSASGGGIARNEARNEERPRPLSAATATTTAARTRDASELMAGTATPGTTSSTPPSTTPENKPASGTPAQGMKP